MQRSTGLAALAAAVVFAASSGGALAQNDTQTGTDTATPAAGTGWTCDMGYAQRANPFS